MSRTDAHTPYWVKRTQAEYVSIHHDHRDGVCDLVSDDPHHPQWVSCHRDVRLSVMLEHHMCGCRMCTGHDDRVRDRRRDRRATRAELKTQKTRPSAVAEEPGGVASS